MGQTPDQKTEKIRAEAQRIGIGNRMNVYPKAGGKVQGRMAEVRSDSFLLTPKKGGAPIEFRFADLERISRDHSKNPWITAAVGIGAAVLIVAAVALSGGN
jgi:hypothetical protein